MTGIECARRAVQDGAQLVRLRNPHRLIYRDGEATCTCGRWRYVCVGKVIRACARAEFRYHVTAPGRPEAGRVDLLEYDCKPFFSGNKRGWTALDSFSASAIVAVWDGLNEVNRAKYGSLRIEKMASVAFKLVTVGGGANA